MSSYLLYQFIIGNKSFIRKLMLVFYNNNNLDKRLVETGPRVGDRNMRMYTHRENRYFVKVFAANSKFRTAIPFSAAFF